jgi:hypothetical protein
MLLYLISHLTKFPRKNQKCSSPAPIGKPKFFTSHDDGTLGVWGIAEKPQEGEVGRTSEGQGTLLKSMQVHEKAIHSMNKHKSMILTASADQTVKAISCASPDMPTCYTARANRPLRCVAGCKKRYY